MSEKKVRVYPPDSDEQGRNMLFGEPVKTDRQGRKYYDIPEHTLPHVRSMMLGYIIEGEEPKQDVPLDERVSKLEEKVDTLGKEPEKKEGEPEQKEGAEGAKGKETTV